jgi:hypothetical protein
MGDADAITTNGQVSEIVIARLVRILGTREFGFISDDGHGSRWKYGA